MRRMMLALALVTASAAAARADDTRVRTSASVEVLDDKAQIDDVISRMRAQQQQAATADTPQKTQTGALKLERPPAPSSAGDASHRAVGPEPKDQRPGSRRTSRDRTANPDRTLAPHLHRR